MGGEGSHAAGSELRGQRWDRKEGGSECVKAAFSAGAQGSQVRGREGGSGGRDAAGAKGGQGQGGRGEQQVMEGTEGQTQAGRNRGLIKYYPFAHIFQGGAPDRSAHDQWEARPLVFHDRHLVMAMEQEGDVASNSIGEETPDVSSNITSILNEHPGPVRSFRLDSSTWAKDKDLTSWLRVLSKKSVQDVTVINLERRSDTSFPIEELQSGNLRILCLGFVGLPNLDLYCFNYSGLQLLHLFCCSFQGLKLAWILTDCTSLRELGISYCKENLTVNSKSLETVRIWGTRANRLVVRSAPKLTAIVTGIVPSDEWEKIKPMRSTSSVSISISGAPSLRSISYLLLPFHNVTINGIPICKVSTRLILLLLILF
jgi:hypothetical protein